MSELRHSKYRAPSLNTWHKLPSIWYFFCIVIIHLVVMVFLNDRSGLWMTSPDYVVNCFGFNFSTTVQVSIWSLCFTIMLLDTTWCVRGYRYNANSSSIHTIVKSFMVLRFPALICTSSSSISAQWRCSIFFFEVVRRSSLLYNYFADGMHLNQKNKIGNELPMIRTLYRDV